MKKEVKTIVYDDQLQLEAYHLEGIVQPFPNHFHEYYVIGLIENGKRCLSCKGKNYVLEKGAMVLFHPGDNHACAQCGEEKLDYRALNIPQERMLALAGEVTGKQELPGFSENVIYNEEAVRCLRAVYDRIVDGSHEFEKEEALLLLISILIQGYGQPFEESVPECREEIERACAYLQQHSAEPIRLQDICNCAGLSKSTLLRAFTKSKGVTPYRYLEAVRISAARKLLEQGATPMEAALQTGFSDQSHFTNYFSRFTGLSPGMYREIFSEKGTEEPNEKRTG